MSFIRTANSYEKIPNKLIENINDFNRKEVLLM